MVLPPVPAPAPPLPPIRPEPPVPPAKVEPHPGTANTAATPRAAAAALRVFLLRFDFIVVPFIRGCMARMSAPHVFNSRC
jgi:hypothetical protein